MTEEDVVAEDQRDPVVADELSADEESLCQAFGLRLLGIGEVDAPFRPVAEKALEQSRVLRGRYDQDLANSGDHQHRQRIVDHRLVVDRKQLFGDRQRQRVETRAGPSGQNYAFHALPPFAINASTGASASRHDIVSRPNVASNLRQSRAELRGLRAGVG